MAIVARVKFATPQSAGQRPFILHLVCVNTWSVLSFPAPQIDLPVNDVRSRLPNRILESTCDGKGTTNSQGQAQNATVQLPQTILEPIPATNAGQTGPARRHGRLVRKQAIDDHGVKGNDQSRDRDDIDAQPYDGHALLDGEGIVEGVVLEREGLVKGLDSIDNGEGEDEETRRCILSVGWEGVSCAAEGAAGSLHDDEVVDNISAAVSMATLDMQPRKDAVRTRL